MAIYYLFFENKRKEIYNGRNYSLGRDKDNDIVLQDSRVSRHHGILEGNSQGFLLKDLGSTNGSWLEGEKITAQQIPSGTQFRLGNCNLQLEKKEDSSIQTAPKPSETMIFEGKITRILEEVKDPKLADKISELKNFYNRKKETLAKLAYRDPLTALYNRRFFDEKLQEEYLRSKRYNRPLSLIMIDIDHFKAFNDNYGHQKGDEVLAIVAAILQETSRASDFLCRYGGEEMTFILPETNREDAMHMAKLCCSRVENSTEERCGVQVTVSLGVSQLSQSDNHVDQLLTRADNALYKAKDEGRNRCCAE